MLIRIDDIAVGAGRRRATSSKVSELAVSIQTVGLQHPIAVRPAKQVGKYILVAGRHRLEAHKRLDRSQIEAAIFADKLDADLWEIAENLHRADLTKLEHNLLVGRWVKLKAQKIKRDQKAKVGQLGPPRGGRQPKSQGINAAARELGIPTAIAKRAVRIASKLSPKAQKAAEKLGLDDNQRALERAAQRTTPETQVEFLHQYVDRRDSRAEEKQRMAALVAGTAQPVNAQEAFERWYWQLDCSWQNKVRLWLRNLDATSFAAYLDQLAEGSTTVIH